MSLGPLMVDIEGESLTAEDREILLHPLVGGVILFSRNYSDPEQLAALCETVHVLRDPPLLVAVDHEGGRVQRFRERFSNLPPARFYGALYDREPAAAVQFAGQMGWLMAAELRAVGVDVSFAPVVDLDFGASSVIGDRALHHDPEIVGELGRTWLLGMRRAGMAACAKHFPGHGAVTGDSHLMLPVDSRDLDEIRRRDEQPYVRLMRLELPAVMMAHVVYETLDTVPASFSKRWIDGELRAKLGFKGAVFCDDLTMQGAAVIGDYPERARTALAAGCDMLPVCNNRTGVTEILDELKFTQNPLSLWRLTRLHGTSTASWSDLQSSQQWRDAQRELTRYHEPDKFTLTGE